MKKREDPEVLIILIVIVAFAACLLTLRPKHALIDEALRAHRERTRAEAEAFTAHPFRQGLQLCMPFDGSTEDLSPLGHAHQDGNVAYVDDGRFGKACRFGTNRSVSLPDLTIHTQGTWSVWIRIARDADASGTMFVLSANGYTLGIANGQLSADFHDGNYRQIRVAAPEKGVWTHVAMTWRYDTKGTIALFLDGRPVGTAPYSGKPTWAERTFGIGIAYDHTREFTGDIDDLCVYDRPLDASELRLLAQKGILALRDAPDSELLAARAEAGALNAAGQTAFETWMKNHPLYRDLAVGLTFEPREGRAVGADVGAVLNETQIVADGKFGRCARFNGRMGIRIPRIRNTRQGTWAAWARVATNAAAGQEMRLLDCNGTGFRLTPGVDLAAFVYDKDSVRNIVSTRIPEPGTWFHLALTWDGTLRFGESKFYVNGNLVGADAHSGEPGFPEMPLCIGMSWDDIKRYTGDIDEACIFNRCLTMDEIRALMNNGLADWDARPPPAVP